MAGNTKEKNNWVKKNLDRISLTVPKGQKELIKAHAEAHSESITAFINRAVSETMARDRNIDEVEETIKRISAKSGTPVKDTRVTAEVMSAIGTLKDFIPNILDLYISSISPKPQPPNPKPIPLKKSKHPSSEG